MSFVVLIAVCGIFAKLGASIKLDLYGVTNPEPTVSCYFYYVSDIDPFLLETQDIQIYPTCPNVQNENNLVGIITNQLYPYYKVKSYQDITTNTNKTVINVPGTVGTAPSYKDVYGFCASNEVSLVTTLSTTTSAATFCLTGTDGTRYCGDTVVPNLCDGPLFSTKNDNIIPGKQYYIEGGHYTLSDKLVVIRPNMIESCSVFNKNNYKQYVKIYKNEFGLENIDKIQSGYPLISQFKDADLMPPQCPILSNIIDLVETDADNPNLLRIELVPTDPNILFDEAKINILNGRMYEIKQVSQTQIRRLWNINVIDIDGSLTLDLGEYFSIEKSPIDGVTFKLEPIFEVSVGVDIDIDARVSCGWGCSFGVSAEFAVTFGVKLGARGTFIIDISDEVNIAEYELYRNEKDFFLELGVVPVVLTPYVALYAGIDISASVELKCVAEAWAEGTLGVEYKMGSGWQSISDLTHGYDAYCELAEPKDGCEITVDPYLKIEAGVLVYRLIDPGVSLKIGPTIHLETPTDECQCLDSSFQIYITLDLEIIAYFRIGGVDIFTFDIWVWDYTFSLPGTTLAEITIYEDTFTVWTSNCFALPEILKNYCCPTPEPTPIPGQPTSVYQAGEPTAVYQVSQCVACEGGEEAVMVEVFNKILEAAMLIDTLCQDDETYPTPEPTPKPTPKPTPRATAVPSVPTTASRGEISTPKSVPSTVESVPSPGGGGSGSSPGGSMSMAYQDGLERVDHDNKGTDNLIPLSSVIIIVEGMIIIFMAICMIYMHCNQRKKQQDTQIMVDSDC